MAEYILGIDIGTGACKCCITDEQGRLVCSESTEYSVDTGTDGSAEQHPEVWYRALIETLAKLKNSGTDLKKIGAAGITGQMRGLTFIGKDGKPADKSILWNDTRCTGEVNYLKQFDRMLRRITYNPMNTMCTMPKILWVMKHKKELWDKTDKVIFPKDYINFCLTGNISTDHSDASGSSFYDFNSCGWSEEIIKEFDIGESKLPVIKNSFEIVGTVSRQASIDTGLMQDIPVYAGGSDATVELFSIGIADDSRCKIRLGSSCGISVVSSDDMGQKAHEHYCWKPVTQEGVVLDINTRFCAQSVKWLRDTFYSELEKTGDTYQKIDDDAKTVGIGSEGLLYHPYMQGEDAPYWNTKLRGMFHGINVSHQRKHFARAVFEGVAFSIKDVIDTYPQIYRNCKEYVMIGGGTQSREWLRIVVDMLGKKAIVPNSGDAAYGACLIALGKQKAVQCISSLLDNSETLYPNTENTEVYNGIFKTYKAFALKANEMN